ncbi:MAG: acyltransferase family protein, partial [Halothiobacillaceae bacterium]
AAVDKPPSASNTKKLTLPRGVSAFCIVVLHYTEHSSLNEIVPGAWVAVDLFFVLSGFVLMHSYAKRISTGMRLSQFIRVRLTRLGPMYVLGSFLGLASALTLMHTQSSVALPPHAVFAASALGFFGLPFFNQFVWPFGHGHLSGPLFPLEVPAWSLFFEATVNVLFFAWLKIGRGLAAPAISISAYVVFVAFTAKAQIFNPGWGSSHFWLGFPRVIAEFFLGIWLYQLRPQAWRTPRLLTVVGSVLFFGLMFSGHQWIEFIDSLFIAPMLIAGAAGLHLHKSLRKTAMLGGRLSYPLYLIHYPLYRILSAIPVISLVSPRVHLSIVTAIAIGLALASLPADAAIRHWLESLP